MDEPTSSLSKGEVENLFKIVASLKQKGIAIMFVSHKLDELFAISDRFTVFRDGTYVGTDTIENMTQQRLISMMVGRDIAFDKPDINDCRNNDVMLEVKNLSKVGNFKDINFKLYKGEVLGITGLVGAGRSELFQAVFGMNSPYSGEVYVKGKRVLINEPWNAKDHAIAYIPESRQTQGLVLQKTVADNITLTIINKLAKFKIVDLKRKAKEAEKWIKDMDVRPAHPDREIKLLSGGNQQKVVISKWLATNPSILIVDEPTNGVDIGAKTEIHNILRKLARNGASVVLISSELPEILAVSDRILVMSRGRITVEFLNENVSQEMIMERAVSKSVSASSVM